MKIAKENINGRKEERKGRRVGGRKRAFQNQSQKKDGCPS